MSAEVLSFLPPEEKVSRKNSTALELSPFIHEDESFVDDNFRAKVIHQINSVLSDYRYLVNPREYFRRDITTGKKHTVNDFVPDPIEDPEGAAQREEYVQLQFSIGTIQSEHLVYILDQVPPDLQKSYEEVLVTDFLPKIQQNT
jgi:hypothetical protein